MTFMRSTIASICLLLFSASATAQVNPLQLWPGSLLPPNASDTVIQGASPFGSFQAGALFVGKFSSANQTLSDIAVVDGSGNINCLRNNGDGTFSAFVNSAVGVQPLASATLLNFGNGTNPQTDTLM